MDLSSHLSTALEGRYRPEYELGEGGMATVYAAHDVRHDRRVALKVLRPELVAVMGAERFLSEIRTTANLQHPHILPLFDSGDAAGFLYYVMPFVEGESLRARLEREKQLAVDEAVRITKLVASALDHAHRNGVIHRDIKPENILLQEGEPVVSDFGIALAVSAAGGGRLTETGLSLGTPYYMSPEQATAERDPGPGSDVYSLGCVLYEMLAGDPPHTGSTAQAVLARILTDRPRPLTELRETVPPNVAAACQRALAKVPADRFPSAAAFAAALDDTSFTYAGATPAASPNRPSVPESRGSRRAGATRSWRQALLPWSLVLVASAIALWGWLRPSAPGAPAIAPTRIDLALERPTGGPGRRIAISPDGRWIAYAGGPGEPLQVRRADETEVRALAGTEGGAQPEFSPDGSWISFAEAGNLYRVPVDGGPALLVYRAGTASSPSWGVDGLIYFVESGELRRVREDGGAAETLPAEGSNVRHPVPLPDASGVLFTEGAFTDANVRLLDLETGEVRPLVSSGAHARYVPTGHLVYGHESQALMAVPFDLARHEVTGSPEPLLNGVGVAADGATQFAVSDAGTAVYLGAGVTAQLGLALVDTAGEIEMLPVLAQPFRPSPRFSPDGHRIAFDDRSQIYTFDLDMGTSAPLTFQGANFYAVWSRDARTLVHRGEGGLHRVPVDGSRRSEPLTEPLVVGVPHAWSPDGVRVLYRAGPGQNLHVLTLGDSAVSTPYLTGDWNEWAAALSPDGAFAAYASDESGSFEVYVRSFPTPGARHQVSVGGGAEPVWAPDGTRIYYRQGDALLAAGVALEPDFRVLGHDTVLADVSGFARFPSFASYDVHPDGDRFVFFRREEGGDAVGGSAVLTVVVGWFDELRARLGS